MVPFARDPENILFNPSQEEEANVRGESHLPSGGGNIPSISAMDVETRDPPDRRGSQKKNKKVEEVEEVRCASVILQFGRFRPAQHHLRA